MLKKLLILSCFTISYAWSQSADQLKVANQIALRCHELIPAEYNKYYDYDRMEGRFIDWPRQEFDEEAYLVTQKIMNERIVAQKNTFNEWFNEILSAQEILPAEVDREKLFLLVRALGNLVPALELRHGNCAQLSILAGLFALKSGRFNRIELVEIKGDRDHGGFYAYYQHNFLVLNRPADSILEKPETWVGAIIIDVWGRGVEEIGVYTTSFQAPEILVNKFVNFTSQNLDWFAISNELSSEPLKKVYLEFVEQFYHRLTPVPKAGM